MLLGAATLWVLVHQRVRGFSVLYRSDSFLALPQYLRNISRRVNDTNDLQRFCLRMIRNPVIPVGLHKPRSATAVKLGLQNRRKSSHGMCADYPGSTLNGRRPCGEARAGLQY